MKKKNVGIIIASIVAVIVIVVGVLAVLYFTTDLFKSEQQLFWKYLSNNTQVLEIISNENGEQQTQWKENNSYTSQGSLKFNITKDSGTKEITLGTTSKHNHSNGRTYSDMTLYNEGTELLTASYINSGDVYAIQCNDIYEPYYIGFRNSNLKEFAANMGATDEEIVTMPDSIPFGIENYSKQISEEEIQYLTATYGKILIDNIAKEKYSKIEKTNISIENQNYEAVGYSLTLNQDDIKQIAVAILTKVREDEQTITILNRLLSDENQTEQLNIQETVVQWLNDLQNQNFEQTTITISVYHKGNEIIKTQVNINNTTELIIDLNTSQESRSYLAFSANEVNNSEGETQGTLMQLTMEKQILNNIVYYTTNMTNGTNDYQITMNTTLGNIINNQMENNSKITIIDNDATIEVAYTKTTQIATEEVEIQELTNSNSVIINNYPMEQLEAFFEGLAEKSNQVLNDKISQLNIQITDYQDVLNYTSGIISSFITIANTNGVEQPVGILGITAVFAINETVNQLMPMFETAENANDEIEKQTINEIMMLTQQSLQIDYLSGTDLTDVNNVRELIEEQFSYVEYEIVDWGNVSFNTTTQELEGTITIKSEDKSYLVDFTNERVEEVE